MERLLGGLPNDDWNVFSRWVAMSFDRLLVWPERGGDPFADRINTIPKYVASRTLSQSDLSWTGSTLLPADDDAIGVVRELRAPTARGCR